jgi:hypothetical protein
MVTQGSDHAEMAALDTVICFWGAADQHCYIEAHPDHGSR